MVVNISSSSFDSVPGCFNVFSWFCFVVLVRLIETCGFVLVFLFGFFTYTINKKIYVYKSHSVFDSVNIKLLTNTTNVEINKKLNYHIYTGNVNILQAF